MRTRLGWSLVILFALLSGRDPVLAGDSQRRSPEAAVALCRKEVWSPAGTPAHRGVFFGVKEGILCAGGRFTIVAPIVDRMLRLMEGVEVHTMVVDSQGGHVGSAVRFGWEMDARKMRLIVSGVCLSSCANYWAPAASELVVVPGGVIAWHGGPSHAIDPKTGALPPDTQASDLFLAALGLSTGFIYRPPANVSANDRFKDAVRQRMRPFWMATPTEMRELFGFKNLGDIWYPVSQAALNAVLPEDFQGLIFLSTP